MKLTKRQRVRAIRIYLASIIYNAGDNGTISDFKEFEEERTKIVNSICRIPFDTVGSNLEAIQFSKHY